MPVMRYWTGTSWRLIATDGADGKSVNVFGPQVVTPIPERKGDVWLVDVTRDFSVEEAEALLAQKPWQGDSLTYDPTPRRSAALVQDGVFQPSALKTFPTTPPVPLGSTEQVTVARLVHQPHNYARLKRR